MSADRTTRQAGYLHATYRDFPAPTPGQDLVLLDTREVEGGGEWSGNFHRHLHYLFPSRRLEHAGRRHPRFFFDDSQTPQAYGTGDEMEWRRRLLGWSQYDAAPLPGTRPAARNAKEAKNDLDMMSQRIAFSLRT